MFDPSLRSRSRAVWLSAALGCVHAGCGPAQDVAPAASSEGAASIASRWVEVRAVGDQALLEAPARVVAGAGARARVSAPFEGRVSSIAVAPGDHVVAGQVLLELNMPAVLDAAARWVSSAERLSLHAGRRGELAGLRAEGLVEAGRVFEQEVSVADLGAERAQALAVLRAASVSPARAAGVLAHGAVAVVAPIDGVVQAVDVALGEVRGPAGAPLVTLSGSAPARIEARLGAALPTGVTLRFVPLDGTPALALRDTPDATVIDPDDGSRLAWISPAQALSLPDGMRGTLRVVLARPGVVEVPARALGHDAQGPFVLRRGVEGPERVRVQVLVSGGGSALVEGALEVGASVAAEAGLLLGPIPEGSEE